MMGLKQNLLDVWISTTANWQFINGVLVSVLLLSLFAVNSGHKIHQSYDEKDVKTNNEKNNNDSHFNDNSKKSIHDPQIASKEHITEHLEEETNMNFSEMTPEELEFYYFKLHDLDNDTMLDGLEIFKALIHTIPEEDFEKYSTEYFSNSTKSFNAEQKKEETKELQLYYYSSMVDNILRNDDANLDGYITYPEFVAGRKAFEKETADSGKQHYKKST